MITSSELKNILVSVSGITIDVLMYSTPLAPGHLYP